MTPRIILPADTTVAVGDTLWWGVEATNACPLRHYPHGPDCQRTVPPEWQALTEACAKCYGTGWRKASDLARSGNQPLHCPYCHEGRRTVEVACGHPLHDTSRLDGGWGVCVPHRCRAGVLGRAVIDGDWMPIVDWKDQRAIATLDQFVATGWEGDPSWFGLYTRGAHLGRKLEHITLHGHTDPGGYAARFKVIAA